MAGIDELTPIKAFGLAVALSSVNPKNLVLGLGAMTSLATLGAPTDQAVVGMVAFVVDYPGSPMEPSTALPVQIYMWANEAERAFVERTSGAIIILLVFLVIMNLGAILLRRRFERRW